VGIPASRHPGPARIHAAFFAGANPVDPAARDGACPPGDAWARLAQGLFQIAFFFNPVVLAANRMADCLREYVCDDAALLASPATRKECGEGLLGIATQTQARPVLMPYALGLSRNGRFIGRRIMRIQDEKRNIQIGLSLKSCIALLLFAALVLPLGGTVAMGQGYQWAKIETQPSPAPRRGTAMAYDSDLQKVILFGGFNYDTRIIYNDTWSWDGKEWKEIPIEQNKRPEKRFMFSMVYDSARKKIVMYGGGDVNKWIGYDQTWEFDGKQWSKQDVKEPGNRVGHAMAYDEIRKKVVLFGGFDSDLKGTSDIWEWDGNQWIKMNPPIVPEPRTYSVMAYDSLRQKTVIFGGAYENTGYRDTWEWDGVKCVKVSDKGPEPRIAQGMAYDSKRQRVVMFGGGTDIKDYGAYRDLSDLWEWDGNQWTKLNITGPDDRMLLGFTYDDLREKIVLFGGTGDNVEHNDTWELGLVTSGLKASLWPKY